MVFYKLVISEKGRGFVATKRIPKNTVLLREVPYLVAEDAYDAIYQIYGNVYGDDENDIIRSKFEALVPRVIDKHTISCDHVLRDVATLPTYMKDFFTTNIKPERLRLLVTKFYRNAFTYHSPPCAILELGTVFNHSCDNNVDFYVDDKSGAIVFETNREVQEGEELSDTYITTNAARSKRRATLLSQYGFECRCGKCRPL